MHTTEEALDAQAIAALLQGGLSMAALGGINGQLNVAEVRQGSDGQGRYLPFFDVVTASGFRVRVSLTPMPREMPDGDV